MLFNYGVGTVQNLSFSWWGWSSKKQSKIICEAERNACSCCDDAKKEVKAWRTQALRIQKFNLIKYEADESRKINNSILQRR